MPLDVNGYNDTFKAFLDFARISESAGETKAIARAAIDVKTGALAGRAVTFSETDSVRGFFKWFRSADDKAANDTTRRIFKDAIIDMFGGESKIPESVKKAMVLADYGKGKPLTARRIIAVQAATRSTPPAPRRRVPTSSSLRRSSRRRWSRPRATWAI